MNKELITLSNWDKAKRAIAECKTISEVKKIKDKAEALRAYAKQAKEGLEIQNNIAEIKIRCERKIGEFSKELPTTQLSGLKNVPSPHDGETGKLSILKDAGIQHYERYESMADIPKIEFDNYIDDIIKGNNEELTSIGVRKLAKKLNPTDVDIPRIPTKDIVLIKGDVLEVKIPEVDVVFTDPPYNVTGIEWDMIGTDKEYLDFTKKWIKRLKWRSHFFVCCSPKYMADYEMILRELNYPIKSRIIWVHKNMSMGKNVKDKFINCYDMIFHCGKTGLNLPKEWTGERFDVKEFANPQTNFEDMKLHQTQKPKALIEEILRLSTKQGDIVLDCFAGSGSTGLTANELGLKCYLIEKEPKFIKLIEKHLCI